MGSSTKRVTHLAHGMVVVEFFALAYGARIHGQSVDSFDDVAAWG